MQVAVCNLNSAHMRKDLLSELLSEEAWRISTFCDKAVSKFHWIFIISLGIHCDLTLLFPVNFSSDRINFCPQPLIPLLISFVSVKVCTTL